MTSTDTPAYDDTEYQDTTVNEPVNEPINEPINGNGVVNEPVNEPINEPVNEPINEPINEIPVPAIEDIAHSIVRLYKIELGHTPKTIGGYDNIVKAYMRTENFGNDTTEDSSVLDTLNILKSENTKFWKKKIASGEITLANLRSYLRNSGLRKSRMYTEIQAAIVSKYNMKIGYRMLIINDIIKAINPHVRFYDETGKIKETVKTTKKLGLANFESQAYFPGLMQMKEILAERNQKDKVTNIRMGTNIILKLKEGATPLSVADEFFPKDYKLALKRKFILDCMPKYSMLFPTTASRTEGVKSIDQYVDTLINNYSIPSDNSLDAGIAHIINNNGMIRYMIEIVYLRKTKGTASDDYVTALLPEVKKRLSKSNTDVMNVWRAAGNIIKKELEGST